MNVSDIMTDRIISVDRDQSVTAAARLLKRHNVGALPVCDDHGRIRGIVTDRDIVLRCVASEEDPAKTKVSDIMSRGVITISPSDSVEKASRLMSEDQVRRIPVLRDGALIGMVTLGDLARGRNCEMEASAALADISSNVKRK